MSDLDVLALTTYDRVLFRSFSIAVEDAIQDLAEDEASAFLEAAGLAENAVVRATRDADRAIRNALQGAIRNTHDQISDATGFPDSLPILNPDADSEAAW
jgi:hypothetical protein